MAKSSTHTGSADASAPLPHAQGPMHQQGSSSPSPAQKATRPKGKGGNMKSC